jgi:ethanolamine phosphate phosphodiesterase
MRPFLDFSSIQYIKILRSADDRDYCDVTHTLPGSDNETHEITVKSFSPARHITQPGFHLLSLYPGPTPTHVHTPCLLPRADGTLTRLYAPAVGLTFIILMLAHMQRARHAARLRLATASPLPSHVDCSQPSPPPLPPLPSPYSASSAYSYSYAYSNTPPSSQRGRDRLHIGHPKRDSRLALGGRRTASTTHELPLPPPPLDHDEGEQDDVRAHYVYVPPASPLPGDLLARRHLARASSPVAAVTGTPGRPWSFMYTFTFRGRRRRIAVHAPAWWPRRTGTRRKGSRVWGAVGRDVVRVIAPALITWLAIVWWYSS